MLRNSDSLAHRRLRGTMDVLLQNCDAYIGLYASLQAGSGAGKTKLDRYRLKTCKNHVVSTDDSAGLHETTQLSFFFTLINPHPREVTNGDQSNAKFTVRAQPNHSGLTFRIIQYPDLTNL